MTPTLSRDVKSAALALCNGLAGPRSEEISRCIQDERWDDLIKIEINPRDYAHAESYFSDVASISFLRKYEPLPTTVDRKKVALDGFFEAELSCYRTNQRLRPFLLNTYGKEEEAMMSIIDVIRKEVVALIGRRPPSNPAGRFGPGSTYGDVGSFATIPDKMQTSPTITREAWSFLVPWAGTLWAKAVASRGDSIDVIRGNRFTTVPKDCTKDRGICIGPSINLFYQLAFGQALRSRMKRLSCHSLDLDTAQEKHRQVACAASISGERATIDLSQASDTVCSSLVKLLLPPMWYEPLADLRETTTEIVVDGVKRNVVLEKFSAMGNGYTFELETVIFMAICNAIYTMRGHKPLPGKNVFVFGDDIIVRTDLANDVIAALRYFGFKTNAKKTFVDGPFRESCGGDFFSGVDVRPYFLKEEPSEPQHFIAMANGIRRMAENNHFSYDRWPHLHRVWLRILDSIPVPIRRCRGPKDLGDLCIHDEREFWSTRTRGSVRHIRVYRPAHFKKVGWHHFDDYVLLAGSIYGVPSGVPLGKPWGGGSFTPRDAVLGYKIGWVKWS